MVMTMRRELEQELVDGWGLFYLEEVLRTVWDWDVQRKEVHRRATLEKESLAKVARRLEKRRLKQPGRPEARYFYEILQEVLAD